MNMNVKNRIMCFAIFPVMIATCSSSANCFSGSLSLIYQLLVDVPHLKSLSECTSLSKGSLLWCASSQRLCITDSLSSNILIFECAVSAKKGKQHCFFKLPSGCMVGDTRVKKRTLEKILKLSAS